MIDLTAPHKEREFLRAMLCLPDMAPTVLRYADEDGLRPDDFSGPNPAAWRGLVDLARSGKPCNPTYLAERVPGFNPAPYLAGNVAPSALDARTYAADLRHLGDLRRLQAELGRAADGLAPGTDPAALLADLARSVRDVGVADELPTLAAAVARFLRERPEEGPVIPWPGGRTDTPNEARATWDTHELEAGSSPVAWRGLHDKIGPLRPDHLAVLVGHTGRGKSAFAVQLAEAAARHGAPVLYVSCEMGTDELVARLLAVRAGGPHVSWRGILNGQAKPEALQAACDSLAADCPALYLWAPGRDGRNALAIQRMARRVARAHGTAPPLVVVDYLQRLAPPGSDNLRGEVRDVSGDLRDLSRPGGLGPEWPGAVVLALSSTARGSYGRVQSVKALQDAHKGPESLEGLGKESGEIEYDAPLLLVMTTDPPGEKDTGAEPRDALVVVVKNRSGRTGPVPMTFDGPKGTFCDRKPPGAPVPRRGR